MKRIIIPILMLLSGCRSYNEPGDYEFAEVVGVANNGNKIWRCFTHINAFVDKRDWYYEVNCNENTEYYKLEHIDEEKLLFIKNHVTKE